MYACMYACMHVYFKSSHLASFVSRSWIGANCLCFTGLNASRRSCCNEAGTAVDEDDGVAMLFTLSPLSAFSSQATRNAHQRLLQMIVCGPKVCLCIAPEHILRQSA